MTKLMKYSAILTMIFLFISTVSFATDIDMNLGNSASSDATMDSTNVLEDTNTAQSATTSNTVTTITSVTNSANTDEGLTLNHILNILLIVVGVVLILLAIAILIRLKG